MLTEPQAQHLFHELGEEIPTHPAPVAQLVRGGRRAVRVRRFLQVGGVVAAVVLVIVAVLAWRPLSSPSTEVAVPPQAPPGTRLVGMGRVAVAVPEDWGTNAVSCGTPLGETVVFDSERARLCLVDGDPGVSSLHIAHMGSTGAQRFVKRAEPAGEVGGVVIERSPIDEAGAGFTGVLVVPSESVAMWLKSPTPETVDEVLDSVLLLPTGYVTVPILPDMPLAGTLEKMKTAGLVVDLEERYRSGWSAGSLISSDPPLGSVVPVGSTVTVVVSGERRLRGPVDHPASPEYVLQCKSSNQVTGTFDDSSEPPMAATPLLASRDWVRPELGETLELGARTREHAIVFVLRPDGTTHTWLDLVGNNVGDVNVGWFISSFAARPQNAPGPK